VSANKEELILNQTTNTIKDGDVLIDIRNITKKFNDLTVLNDISTQIRKGEVVCVIGPSGSGKSTFLRCLNRLETPTSGQILFEGSDILAPDANIDLHRQKMGMVFQQFNLFPHMSILDNLTLAPTRLLKRDKKDAEAEAMELLERVGLPDKANAFPLQLSGGQ
jgi:polar amino acid transport system ATP-binding protein